MSRLLDSLEIESGHLYFNHTVGLSSFEVLSLQPFQDHQNSTMKSMALTGQSWFFITYPFLWFQNRFVANQGSELIRAKRGDEEILDRVKPNSYYQFLKKMGR